MKIAIVVAAALVVAFASLIALRPDLFRPTAVKKSDIFGITPGMSLEETNKLITQRRYRCRPLSEPYVTECTIDGAKVTITADTANDAHPVARIAAELAPGRDSATVARAISDQYNAEPTKTAKGWAWTIGPGYRLSYDGAAITLTR